MPNPLVRLGRTRNLDPAKDRLFYRTAPLGLLRTDRVRKLGLRFETGVRVSEDLDFGVRMWANGERVDFLRHAPCYVIGRDAAARTTEARLSLEDEFEAHNRLLDKSDLLNAFRPAVRRALAIKIARVSVVAKVRARRTDADWRGDDEVATAAALLRRLVALAPGVLAPFNRQERYILDALLTEPTVARITREAARAAQAGRAERWLTKNPLHAFDRESTLRRYVLYFLMRDRSAQRS